MLKPTQHKVPWLIMALILAAPSTTFACAACAGRSDDALARGLNAAVLTLLAVLLAVLGTLVASLAYLIRRASKHPVVPPGASAGVPQSWT